MKTKSGKPIAVSVQIGSLTNSCNFKIQVQERGTFYIELSDESSEDHDSFGLGGLGEEDLLNLSELLYTMATLYPNKKRKTK